MASIDTLLNLKNSTVRFRTSEGEYEGMIKEVFPTPKVVIVGKLILLPDRRMGSLQFRCSELENLVVINRADNNEKKSVQEVLPVYAKTITEKLLDLDGGSDIEDEENADNLQADYKLKVVPHLSKCVPKDFEIIDTFDKDFSLAINHIKRQQAIGVSLEGPKISRSGTLTWLCISTKSCIFLFDILALGALAFKKGLKFILESGRIQKILHDCRLASDCLYHKYGTRLVNVFDTQAADFIVMMQMVEREKIDGRVNSLDACLHYYLEIPSDYLYAPANLNTDANSFNFHASRPLKHEIQDVFIKNVMYLQLLKRELEVALMTPLRRATDVYLNCIQKLKEKELLIVPHKPDELPLDIHLEGIQIFRYRDFEYLCNTTASGPPYREIHNPIKNYLNHRAEYKNGQKKDIESIVNKYATQNLPRISSEVDGKANVDHLSLVPTSRSKSVSDSSGASDGEHSTPNTDNLPVEDKFEKKDPEKSSNTLINPNSIVKPVGFDSSKSVKAEPSRVLALRRLLDDYEKSRKAAVVDSNRESQKPEVELSNVKSAASLPINMSKAVTSRIYESSIIAETKSSSKDSTNNNGIISKPLFKKDVEENNSINPKDVDLSDSDLKALEARVKARGAVLRKQKMIRSVNDCVSQSVPKSGKAQDNFVKEIGNNQKHASEDVTICYSETLDKPSKFVATVSHKSTRLVDLYKNAGDMNMLWTEDSDNCSKTTCTQPDNCDDIWSAIRANLPCTPIDDKLKARFVPAGMSGY